MPTQPKVLKKTKAAKTRKHRVQAPKEIHGVVYIGHLTEGFCEPQMREYFKQFGNVKQLRLSRSKRTGGSRGYAFVQFENDDIAKVVAETMNGYSMFKKVMTCQHVPAEKVHPFVFRGAQRIFRRPKAHLFASQRHNKVLTERREKLAVRKLKNKMQKRLDKLNKLGVNYTLPGHGNEIAEAKSEEK